MAVWRGDATPVKKLTGLALIVKRRCQNFSITAIGKIRTFVKILLQFVIWRVNLMRVYFVAASFPGFD
jgi:hypothetical protein